jgi:predicted nucleotidyltransferase component of viral defense system
MKEKRIKNVAASVRQRLQTLARSSGRPFQEVVQYFAMERFLYRLSKTPHRDRFVLKGALMLTVWGAPEVRPTRDIDLLGRTPNIVGDIEKAVRDVCLQPVDPDGLVFHADTVRGASITEDADYEGVRVTFRGSLERMRIPMQVDVGFGDVLHPSARMTEYPTTLGHAAPKLRGYSRETTIAEKFEAMVKLGLLNSRMKDFYDVWLLSRQFEFKGRDLALAIQKTFANRHTALPAEPVAFDDRFSSEPTKMSQWRAFLRKSRLVDAPTELTVAVEAIASFLGPPASAAREGKPFTQVWKAPGPWRKR